MNNKAGFNSFTQADFIGQQYARRIALCHFVGNDHGVVLRQTHHTGREGDVLGLVDQACKENQRRGDLLGRAREMLAHIGIFKAEFIGIDDLVLVFLEDFAKGAVRRMQRVN